MEIVKLETDQKSMTVKPFWSVSRSLDPDIEIAPSHALLTIGPLIGLISITASAGILNPSNWDPEICCDNPEIQNCDTTF